MAFTKKQKQKWLIKFNAFVSVKKREFKNATAKPELEPEPKPKPKSEPKFNQLARQLQYDEH